MSRKEYGSNFCEEIQESNTRLEDSEKVIFLDSGRSALRYLLRQLGGSGFRVMLPQYTCESVIEPFGECGCHISYYPINKNFEIERSSFMRMVKETHPQLILIQSYFGANTLKNMRSDFKELQMQGVWIVEDITHAFFAGWKGQGADFMVGSLRKWCAIPDGGVLASVSARADRLLTREKLGQNTQFVDMRVKAQQEKRSYFVSEEEDNFEDKKRFIKLFDDSEAILDKQVKCYAMSEYTRKRLGAVDWDSAANRRKQNYAFLRESIMEMSAMGWSALELEGGEVPLYFPVYIRNGRRDELRQWMRKKNILLPVIWPMPQCLADKVDADVKWIYENIIAIPCDQRYDVKDIGEVLEQIGIFLRESENRV